MRYWWYTANGGLYDPKAGESLSPRQQLRECKGSKSRSDASLARQILEYRQRHPDKAVLCWLDPANGWAVLAAGGSVPRLPPLESADLRAALMRMTPFASSGLTESQWCIAEPGRNYLIYSARGDSIRLELKASNQRYSGYWIQQKTGGLKRHAEIIDGGREIVLQPPGSGQAVLWLTAEPKKANDP